MILAAALVLWNARIFTTRPATGFTVTLIFMGAGSVTGPAVAGVVADRLGLAWVFAAAGVIAALAVRASSREGA